MEINRKALVEKWAPVIDADGVTVSDAARRGDLAVILENQAREMARESQAFNMLSETAPTNSGGTGGINAISTSGYSADQVAGFDPVLINLVRRAMPQLIAYDVCGVQPMTQPTGLIFALRSRYVAQNGKEALFNEPATGYSGGTINNTQYTDPTDATNYANSTGRGMSTDAAETLGSGSTFPEMAFSIEKTSVVAKTRALKAERS